MRNRRLAGVASVLGFVALTFGCASGGGTAGGGAQTQEGQTPPAAQGTTVTILNTAPGASTVTVYMKPEIGVDTPLGTVEGGQTRTFAFGGPPGYYQLRVVGAGGERLSERFQLFRNSAARWDMSAGRNVRVGGRD